MGQKCFSRAGSASSASAAARAGGTWDWAPSADPYGAKSNSATPGNRTHCPVEPGLLLPLWGARRVHGWANGRRSTTRSHEAAQSDGAAGHGHDRRPRHPAKVVKCILPSSRYSGLISWDPSRSPSCSLIPSTAHHAPAHLSTEITAE